MPLSYERQDAQISQDTLDTYFPDGVSSNLPLVFINTYGQPTPDEPKITADIGIVHDGGVNKTATTPELIFQIKLETIRLFFLTIFTSLVGLEVRGSTSLKFAKRGFSVELKNVNASLCLNYAQNDMSDNLGQFDINQGKVNVTEMYPDIFNRSDDTISLTIGDRSIDCEVDGKGRIDIDQDVMRFWGCPRRKIGHCMGLMRTKP